MEMNSQENQIPLIAGPEDEDFLEDEARIVENDHGPFSDIMLLKQRPAHTAVFLQFVMRQHDPIPLLFFLCDDILKNDQHKSQEKRSLFFNQNAPVRASFPEEIEMHLRPLNDTHSDEDFLSAEEKTLKWATDIVVTQLEDYRKQRVMGLASFFGGDALTEVRQGSMRETADALQLFKSIHYEINTEDEKSNAVLKALEGYLKYRGILTEVIGKRRHLFNLKKNLTQRREREKEKEKEERKEREKEKEERKEREKEKEERKEREKARGQVSLLKDVLRPAHRSYLDEGYMSNVNHIVKKFEQPMQDKNESRGVSDSKLGHNTRLGRSESWKGYADVQRKVCHPGTTRSMSDIDLSTGRGTIQKQRPSLKLSRAEAVVPTFSDKLRFENNADLKVEAEASEWQANISRDVLKQLSNQAIKRQDVINELFHTERLHVKSLYVLKVLFRDNLVEKGVMEEALAESVFPHLASLLQQHGRISAMMRNMQQPGVIVGCIGDMLVEQFSGENAQQLQQAAAAFCSQQSASLETLKHNQKKDQKFQQVIQAAESNPHCRRLQLKDLLPEEMQRLTKYPLLLKKLAKYSSENAEDKTRSRQQQITAAQSLTMSTSPVREAENAFYLQGYQRKLDLSALQQKKIHHSLNTRI
uniref:rho guanine nucleotide exchange factor 11-like isoform X2 n=1 Tax=Myxine glutinosa TaxID=7769 RepID=UPI00358F3118